jgi:hypothetical protein
LPNTRPVAGRRLRGAGRSGVTRRGRRRERARWTCALQGPVCPSRTGTGSPGQGCPGPNYLVSSTHPWVDETRSGPAKPDPAPTAPAGGRRGRAIHGAQQPARPGGPPLIGVAGPCWIRSAGLHPRVDLQRPSGLAPHGWLPTPGWAAPKPRSCWIRSAGLHPRVDLRRPSGLAPHGWLPTPGWRRRNRDLAGSVIGWTRPSPRRLGATVAS